MNDSLSLRLLSRKNTMTPRYASMLEVLLLVGKTLVFAIPMLLLASHWFADPLIFHRFPASYGPGPRYFAVQVSGIGPVSCRFLATRDSPWLIVYSHGNGEDLGGIEGVLQGFPRSGMSVLAYDYPGYGLSAGRASEASCNDALEAVIHHAVEVLGYPLEHIVLYGRSLGSGPSVHFASQHPVGGLILEGAFLSTFKVALNTDLFPWDRFRNGKIIAKVTAPILVFHGTGDEVIPFAHGKTLFERATSRKLHYWVEGAGHNDLVAFLGADYWAVISEFLGSLR